MDPATIIGLILAAYPVFYGSRSILEHFGKNRLTPKEPVPLLPAPPLTDYRLRVRVAHRRLRFGDPLSGQLAEPGSSRMSLADVYTAQFVATEFAPNDGGGGDVRPAQLTVEVTEALRHQQARRAVVLGDPGSGKSTLTDHLIAESSADDSPVLPVHVRLSQLDLTNGGDFWGGVTEAASPNETSDQTQATIRALETRLAEGQSLIVFDGLDEVPERLVPSVVAEVIRVADAFPEARVVVTCRQYDYDQEWPNRRLPFTKLRLLPFRETDMLEYVEKWYTALKRLDFISDGEARMRNLQDALRNSAELAELAATPLLLTLMALIHTTEGELPRARALLFHKTVTHLLSERPQWRKATGTSLLSASDLLPIAQKVAAEVQTRDEAAGQPIVGLTQAEIDEIVRAHLRILGNGNATARARSRQSVDALVARLLGSNGLLAEVLSGRYNFTHKSLKEFLAGMHYLTMSDLGAARTTARRAHWREPMILMAGYGGREGNALYFLSKLIEALIADAASAGSDGLHLKLLAGDMLAEIGADTLRMRGQAWVVDPSDDKGAPTPLWRTVVSLLNDSHRGARTLDRIKIFQVLGRLGDPRLVDVRDELVPPISRLAFLPATEVVVGDDSPARPKEKSALVVTVPLRTVSFGPMHVSIYHVTNREYADFIDDGGYQRRELWTPNGRRWLSGERVGSSRVDLQACKLEYSIVSPK